MGRMVSKITPAASVRLVHTLRRAAMSDRHCLRMTCERVGRPFFGICAAQFVPQKIPEPCGVHTAANQINDIPDRIESCLSKRC